jgi:hypothetical protein
MITEKQMVSRVQKGIKFLNKTNPGWHKKVKLKNLDMFDDANCILGQLYGGLPFYEAIEKVGIRQSEVSLSYHNAALDAGSPYGFSFTYVFMGKLEKKDPTDKLAKDLFKQLTEVWKTEIRKLRA